MHGMRSVPALLCLLLLLGCGRAREPVPAPMVATGAVAPLEREPAELSLAHFARMRLEGTDFLLGDVLADTDAYVRHAITYRSNGLLISGIMNIPKGDGPFPLVIFNHGYIDPAVYTQGRGLKREQDALARRGFAVLHTDYRGHAGSDPSPNRGEVYDGALEYAMDSLNAIDAVRRAAVPRVDASRVGMLGHSMGGGVTLAILTAHPDAVAAAVLYAPVHADVWENYSRWRSKRDQSRDRTTAVLGTRATNPTAWNALSPQSMLHKIAVPVLVFQGGRDADVPEAWSDDLVARLRDADKDVAYVEYAAEGHEFAAQWTDFIERTATFFGEHLGEPLVPPMDPARVTLKPFGIRVDPADSPVQPERFSGYHTGIDFEAPEDGSPSVRAACTGPIIERRMAQGYGGVAVQRCMRAGRTWTVVYGHVALASVPPLGAVVQAGEPMATLGAGFSPETDGERPHLHFAVHRGDTVDLRGYVPREVDLRNWLDPLTLF